MSEEPRSWESQFAPPPPPPLTTRAPAGEVELLEDDTSEPAPSRDDQVAGSGARQRRLSAVPVKERPAPSGQRRGNTRPGRADTVTSASPAPASQAGAAVEAEGHSGDRGTLKALGSRLLLATSDLGVDIQLVGMREHEGSAVFELRLGAADDATELLARAEELSAELGAPVEVVVGEEPQTVSVEVGPEVDAHVAAGPARQSVVYLPLQVRTAVDQARAESAETFTAFFLGAFNRQYHRLEEMFPRRLAASGPMPMGRSGARKRRGEGTLVQAWVYLNDEQRAVLDEAVRRSNAGSRSALITKVLEFDVTEDDDYPAVR